MPWENAVTAFSITESFFLLESVHKVIILLEIHHLPSRACSLSTHLSLNHLRTDSRIL